MVKTFFSNAKLELPLVYGSDYNVVTSLFKRSWGVDGSIRNCSVHI